MCLQRANRSMTIIVTGLTGFLGGNICSALFESGYKVKGVVRSPPPHHSLAVTIGCPYIIRNLEPDTDWSDLLFGVDTVIHCAARVHSMQERSDGALDDFRITNVEGTKNLAEQAASFGARRFIFLSTAKVNGEVTSQGSRFTAHDDELPTTPYSISKWEAEQVLRRISNRTQMELVILRPPMVYGPGVKGNFFSMLKWLHRGYPLPLGAIQSKRSLVALDNLVSLIVACIHHPAAVNQTFLVSDDDDISVAGLAIKMGKALGRPARLVAMPPAMMNFCMRALGKDDMSRRLLQSLQLDISHTKKTLAWAPPCTIDEELRKTVHWFQTHK